MAIYLESNQVPAFLRSSYSGSKFRAEPCESVYIPSDAGLWDGGSRTSYTAIELNSGRVVALPGQTSAPWDASRVERKIDLKPGFAIVAHRMFKGNDLGLTFYVHPADIAALIPADTSASLTETEKTVLAIIRSRKAAYRADEYRRKGIADSDIEAIKAGLIKGGFLNKAGAITVQGRNACEGIYI